MVKEVNFKVCWQEADRSSRERKINNFSVFVTFFLKAHVGSEKSQQVMGHVLEGPVSAWEWPVCGGVLDPAGHLCPTPHARAWHWPFDSGHSGTTYNTKPAIKAFPPAERVVTHLQAQHCNCVCPWLKCKRCLYCLHSSSRHPRINFPPGYTMSIEL